MVSSAFKGDQGATQYSAKSAKKGQMGSRLLTYPTQVDVTLMLLMMMIVRDIISKFWYFWDWDGIKYWLRYCWFVEWKKYGMV